MHILEQIQHPKVLTFRNEPEQLHVVAVCSNPVGYHSRYRLAREFIERMRGTEDVTLTMVEAAFGSRQHEVTSEESNDLQVRTRSEIWIKENLINLGMRKVLANYPEAKYLAWVDADVNFLDPTWASKAIQALQHYDVIQPWSDCLDLNYDGGIIKHHRSFGIQHQRRVPKQTEPSQPYEYAHPGYAWACTRRFWEATQGLLDCAILGSADHHMAWSAVGQAEMSLHGKMSGSFNQRVLDWERRALRVTHGEVGYVSGRIEHEFHGPKARRYYRERWQILLDHQFDPARDLYHDEHGVLQLDCKPRLEQAIRQYNRSRFEDSIEEV